jgi:dihydrolipoamide dehydrogenase
MQTSLPGVYAIGDVVGGMMLAHKASAEAKVAVANILGKNRTIHPHVIPRCIWGVTEIGAVGFNEDEANAAKKDIKIGKFSFTGSGSAQAMGQTYGFAKVICDRETGEILGVHIIGEHATDLIGDAVTAMTMEAVVEDLAIAVKPHPTLSETVMEAAMDWFGTAIHKLKRSDGS